MNAKVRQQLASPGPYLGNVGQNHAGSGGLATGSGGSGGTNMNKLAIASVALVALFSSSRCSTGLSGGFSNSLPTLRAP